VLPSLAEGKRGEDGKIIYIVIVAAEGIKFGLAGTALLHSKKKRQTFRCPLKEYLSDVE
jgi:hypothetical protein